MPTINMSMEEIEAFHLAHQAIEVPSSNTYIMHLYKIKGASVSIYFSGKVVFQGNNLEPFKEYIKEVKVKKDLNEYPYDLMNTIGSDEVGTGDVFGPIVVATCFVRSKDTIKLKGMGVKDSKVLTDSTIIDIGKKLTKILKFRVTLVRNETYNNQSNKYNMNEMKALLHDQNFRELSREVNYDSVCLDQFCSREKYFSYLPSTCFKNISFETKGESKSVAVAAASIIARCYFLIEMERLQKTYGYFLPKGSGEEANKLIKQIKKDKREAVFKYIAKLNFKNFKSD